MMMVQEKDPSFNLAPPPNEIRPHPLSSLYQIQIQEEINAKVLDQKERGHQQLGE